LSVSIVMLVLRSITSKESSFRLGYLTPKVL
jgi:hypothetical protein